MEFSYSQPFYSSGTLLRVFAHVAHFNRTKGVEAVHLLRHQLEEKEFIQDYELDLRTFLQAVLLIGIKCAGNNMHELHLYLEALIRDKIIPGSLNFDLGFRESLQQLDVFRLFHIYRKYTLRAFYTYSISRSHGELDEEATDNQEKWNETIDFQEFYQMCKDAGFVDEVISRKQLYYIFSSVQQDAFEMNGDTAAELTFPEFLEALGAIAIYKRPIPYETLLARIEKFLRIEFVPFVKRTIVLS